MEDKLYQLHTKHLIKIKKAFLLSSKIKLFYKFVKETIENANENSENQIIHAGTYIYGLTFPINWNIKKEIILPDEILKIRELSLEIEAYGMNPDGNLNKYWNKLKEFCLNLK